LLTDNPQERDGSEWFRGGRSEKGICRVPIRSGGDEADTDFDRSAGLRTCIRDILLYSVCAGWSSADPPRGRNDQDDPAGSLPRIYHADDFSSACRDCGNVPHGERVNGGGGGFRAYQVILARLGMVIGVSAVASGVSIGVMMTAFQPELLLWFIAGTTLTALIYGMIGLLVGVLLDRLLGIYLILFGSMIDLFVFQNPLAKETPLLARVLPGHFPLQLVMEAGFKGAISPDDLGYTFGYLCLLTILGIFGFYRATGLS